MIVVMTGLIILGNPDVGKVDFEENFEEMSSNNSDIEE